MQVILTDLDIIILGFLMFLLQNTQLWHFYYSFAANRHICFQNDQLGSIGFIYFS